MKTHFLAFYSYKGGVGRTLALANVARLLAAEEGKKVVVMDFDLEAPGLDHFDVFRPDGEKLRRGKAAYPHLAGFAEYLQSCRTGTIPETLAPYCHPCQGLAGDKGKVWLMPAGRRGGAAHDAILTLDWKAFYAQENGYKLMENLRGHIEDELKPDYVLMDARTGLSEMGGIATHQLADTVVLLFNLNRQNLEGTQRVHDSLHQLDKPPLTLLAVSPIPAMPAGKGTPFTEKMREIRRTLSKAANAEQPIVIPYQPILALEERILVDHQDDPFDYDGAYRALLKLIQQHLNDPKYFLRIAGENWQNNDIKGAIETLETGLKDNPGNPDLSIWLANLRQDASSLAVAGKIQEERIADLRKTLGENDLDTLTAMSKLAETRRRQGDLTGARDLLEQVFVIRRRVLGEEHTDSLTAMIDLAHTLWAQGDLNRARALQEQVLDMQRRVLGEEHPNTLKSMNNLAATLAAQGNLADAHDLEEKVLDIQLRVLGEENQHTLAAMNNLAEMRRMLGDLSGARDLQEKVLATNHRMFGEEHPNTLFSTNNLAVTLYAQGDLDSARDLQKRVQDIQRRVLGEEHPDTLCSMSNLAATLAEQGDLPGARGLQENALAIQRRVLGDEHPDTCISAFNLLVTLLDNGETAAAESLFHDYLAWILQRDPDSLGADQRSIQGKLRELFPQQASTP